MVGQTKFNLKECSALNLEHVKIKDRAKVEAKLNELINGTFNKLQMVTDFDFTITKQRLENGAKVLTSFGMFDTCKSVPASVIAESQRLKEKYRPIEIDPHMTVDEKIVYMVEWWAMSSDILKGFPLPTQEIEEVANIVKKGLRDGTHKLFLDLYKQNVPTLVFSAGLGDCVVAVLKQAEILFPNVKVVSNFLQYDKEGLLNGLQDNPIHIFNKNETALEGSDYYEIVHNRDHVIVMGDTLGDAGMAEGMPASSHVLKIGFLFDHPELMLAKYMDTFDIVLVDDQTMDVPQTILDLIKMKN